MRYFDIKKDSLEEVISKAINEKPEQLEEINQLNEFEHVISFTGKDGLPAYYLDKIFKGSGPAHDAVRKLEKKTGSKQYSVMKYPPAKGKSEFDKKKRDFRKEEVISKAINEDNKPSAKELVDEGGKYLKYSDLLLQKGRLLAKKQNTAMIDKEIKKEMQKLGIKEETGDKEKYEKFFKAALKKFGADSPADLDGEKKKEFFNYIDKNYKGDHEESVDLEEVNAKVIMDKDTGNRDLQKLLKKHKLKMKTLQPNVNPGYDEVEISGDKRDMEKMMKTTGDDSMYKFNPRTKEFELDESKKLESKTTKDVDETLEKIREANVEKGRTMRNILADIWNMGEGKSVFDKEEKVKKEEEDEKGSSKTMTGKKATKVEIEPEVK